MKNRREIIVFVGVVLLSFLVTNVVVAVEPTIGEVILNPDKPEPQSDVTFSVDVTGDNVSSVWLAFKECKPGLCYQNKNVSMTKVGENYEANVTLESADTTYITYHIEMNSNGEWIHSESVDLTLAEKTNGGQDDGNGNDGEKTPGFELVPVVIAVGIALLLFGRKRL